MSRIQIMLIILFGILAALEISNIIYYHKERIKYEKNRFLNLFKRKKKKNIEFD